MILKKAVKKAAKKAAKKRAPIRKPNAADLPSFSETNPPKTDPVIFKAGDWDFSPCPFKGNCPHGGHKGKEFCPHKILKVKK